MTVIDKFTIIRFLAGDIKGSHSYIRGFKDALATMPYEVLLEMYNHKGHKTLGQKPQREQARVPEPVSIDAWRKPSSST